MTFEELCALLQAERERAICECIHRIEQGYQRHLEMAAQLFAVGSHAAQHVILDAERGVSRLH